MSCTCLYKALHRDLLFDRYCYRNNCIICFLSAYVKKYYLIFHRFIKQYIFLDLVVKIIMYCAYTVSLDRYITRYYKL